MTRFALFALLALPLAAPPALADITVTGDGGGSIVIDRGCTRGEGQIDCTRTAVRTGPEGKVATRVADRTLTRGQIDTAVSVTRADGETRTRTRTVTRD
jgi:hypothetical protein